ncbi:EspA/EspE family type VII secretion system effector [Mycobacterium kyogaense]|uniref:EspA/EspE family type VII secretion system effector n=1 Tax=Mycobacterium kyogaense TaxID=2212479 RepID=UPI000DACB368|nr:EspA/EspE family type VII secretion system effector [Mycobacterium kyogaense]
MDVSDVAGALGKVGDGACGPLGATDVLGAGQRVIAEMRSTTGHGCPDAGEAFADGATGFLAAVQTIARAYPREEWEGSGARSYAAATRRLAGATEALAVLDRDVHTVIDREANQIIRRRETLDDQALQLSSLRRVTGSLATIPGVGTAMTSSIELAAVVAAVGVCGTELHHLAAETADNAHLLRRIAEDYASIVEATEPVDEDAPAEDLPADDAVGVAPADEPTDSPPVLEATSPAPVTPPAQSMCPAPAAATAAEQPPMQGDPMSGLTSAFGAVGGMIGAAVAPLAAVLSGVVTAAGQLPSLATQASAPQVDVPNAEKDVREDTHKDEPDTDQDDPPAADDPESADPVGAAVPEPAASPERAPSPPPAPAPTRPPQ